MSKTQHSLRPPKRCLENRAHYGRYSRAGLARDSCHSEWRVETRSEAPRLRLFYVTTYLEDVDDGDDCYLDRVLLVRAD